MVPSVAGAGRPLYLLTAAPDAVRTVLHRRLMTPLKRENNRHHEHESRIERAAVLSRVTARRRSRPHEGIVICEVQGKPGMLKCVNLRSRDKPHQSQSRDGCLVCLKSRWSRLPAIHRVARTLQPKPPSSAATPRCPGWLGPSGSPLEFPPASGGRLTVGNSELFRQTGGFCNRQQAKWSSGPDRSSQPGAGCGLEGPNDRPDSGKPTVVHPRPNQQRHARRPLADKPIRFRPGHTKIPHPICGLGKQFARSGPRRRPKSARQVHHATPREFRKRGSSQPAPSCHNDSNRQHPVFGSLYCPTDRAAHPTVDISAGTAGHLDKTKRMPHARESACGHSAPQTEGSNRLIEAKFRFR